MISKTVLKKYPNRRLYDTNRSGYVTLEQVAKMVKNGAQIEVIDAKTGEDVTAFILTQILMDQVRRNNSLLPVSLLHLIIRFGEDVLNEFFEKYLEKTIRSYLNYKNSMDEQFRLCIELGMDFSNMTKKTIKELKPFKPFFDKETESAPAQNRPKDSTEDVSP